MTRQHIRLKEFDHNINKIHVPSESYLTGAPQLDKNKAYYMCTDDNGFISTGNYFKSDLTIAVVGDSFVENIFVDELDRFESILERRFLKEGKRLKVLNAGVSGMTGLSACNLILNKIVRIKPDILIFVQPSIDFSTLLFKDGYFNDSKLFSNLVPPRETQIPIYETIFQNVHQIYNNIALISRICELNKINLIISTCASNSSKRQLSMMNSIVRDNADNFGYSLLDLDKILEKSDKYFYDKQHLNADGAEQLSKILYEYLLDNSKFIFSTHDGFKFKETSVNLSLSNKTKIELFSNKDKRVESWLYIVSEPNKNDSSNGIFKIDISFTSADGQEYIKTIDAIGNKILKQSINLGNLKAGVYSVGLKMQSDLPITVNDCKLFTIIDNL